VGVQTVVGDDTCRKSPDVKGLLTKRR